VCGRFFIPADRNQYVAICIVQPWRQRVGFFGRTQLLNRLAGSSEWRKKKGYVILTRQRRVGIEFNCAPETGFRPIPLCIACVNHAQCVMRFFQQGVQLNGMFGRGAHSYEVIRFGAADTRQISIRLGETGVCGSKGGIFGDGILERNGAATANSGRQMSKRRDRGAVAKV
jgi:hypothetical protein